MGIWAIGMISLILWDSLIEGLLNNSGILPDLMNGSTNLRKMINVLKLMIAYRLTTYALYYSLLKNVEFGWRKSTYWFLMVGSVNGKHDQLDSNKRLKSLSRIDEFMDSLSM
jgi:hypothetical protein